ncbi:MAG: hypothetical protein ACXADH_14600 [Candidatus Kariarchaeaceae archaeon]|jgi:hypothetical protein
MGSIVPFVAPLLAPGLQLGAKRRIEQNQTSKARREAGEKIQNSQRAAAEAEEKESLRRRIFSGIRTGSPLGLTSGSQNVARTRLLGG